MGVELAAAPLSTSAGRAPERRIYFCAGLDRDARRGGAGRCDLAAEDAQRRLAIPAAKLDHLSHLLRDFRDAGVSRPVAAVLYSPIGISRRCGEESGRGTGALRDDRSRARLSGTSA